MNNRVIYNTYDISNFESLKTFKLKIESVIADLNRSLKIAEDIDRKQDLYYNTVKIRKMTQKVRQKIQNIRVEALEIRKKVKEEPTTEFCPDPDYAFSIECPFLGESDTCKDKKDCILCSDT